MAPHDQLYPPQICHFLNLFPRYHFLKQAIEKAFQAHLIQPKEPQKSLELVFTIRIRFSNNCGLLKDYLLSPQQRFFCLPSLLPSDVCNQVKTECEVLNSIFFYNTSMGFLLLYIVHLLLIHDHNFDASLLRTDLFIDLKQQQ